MLKMWGRLLGALVAIGILGVAGTASANTGVDSKDLEYRQWNSGKPTSFTVTSGVIGGIVVLWGPPLGMGVTWRDSNGNLQWRQMEVLCRLNKGSKLKCGEVENEYHHRVQELYIGPPEGLRLPGGQKTNIHAPLSQEDLRNIPPNVKKVILANVTLRGMFRQALTAVYDESISDDDLRTLLMEDGVYRVFRWRED